MPVDGLAGFERRMAAWQRGVNAADRVGVVKAAQVMKRVTLEQLTAATGGDLRLSGTAGSGTKRASGNVVRSKAAPSIGVRYRVEGESAVVRPFGPVQLIEGDTKAHTIGSRYGKQARSKRARAAATSGGRRAVVHFGEVYAASVKHPGTKGRHPWEKGVDEATPLVVETIAKAQSDALTEAFR